MKLREKNNRKTAHESTDSSDFIAVDRDTPHYPVFKIQ